MEILILSGIVAALVCGAIQFKLIRLVRVRFPDQWAEWGRPAVFAPKLGSISFVRLLLSRRLLQLGDLEISWWTKFLRVMWAMYAVLFLLRSA
jgi:hypothetical protein